MLLADTSVRNIVQSIRAYPRAGPDAGCRHARPALPLRQPGGGAVASRTCWTASPSRSPFPAHFGKNLDALYDCMTDPCTRPAPQPGFVVVLEQMPDNPRFDREAREQLLDVFRDAADFWAERKVPFRCFYSFQ